MAQRMPAVFVGHGSPQVALWDDDPFVLALRAFGARLPRPQAIVVVSAHWQEGPPFRVTASPAPRLIYDFSGFPPKLHRFVHPCPGAPALAADLLARLGAAGLEAIPDPERGLDHGVWVPLHLLFPRTPIPVVALSLLPDDAAAVERAGRALAPLREQGILLLGSGGVVHNLGRLAWQDKAAPVEGWARDFDAWARQRIAAHDGEGLRRRAGAPAAALAVPSTEHFDPILFVLGAADPGEPVVWLYEGFHYGTLSLRSFAFGGPASSPQPQP
jgi:4,5-DOPA dioxygenase extradiol